MTEKRKGTNCITVVAYLLAISSSSLASTASAFSSCCRSIRTLPHHRHNTVVVISPLHTSIHHGSQKRLPAFFSVKTDRRKRRRRSRSLLTLKSTSTDDYYEGEIDEYGPLDYAITDSISLPENQRPSAIECISNPRDMLALSLVVCGFVISYHNIIGDYSQEYQYWQQISILLGFCSLGAAMIQIWITGYEISSRPRRGVIDDVVMNIYAGLYSGCVSWLALRASDFCPLQLHYFDGVMATIASSIFVFSLAAPIITLVENNNNDDNNNNKTQRKKNVDGDTSLSAGMTRIARLDTSLSVPSSISETELFRTQGLLAIGVLGCVFVPDCIAFGIGSSDWWNRITTIHPSQKLLESSTALFALYATEASMVATRCANKGLKPYRVMVPIFAIVCFILAIIPCVCSLYWLGDDVSFFSFYRE